MKKTWILPGLLAGAFALAATGLAAGQNNGHGHGKNKNKFGPYNVVTDDNGSCGEPAWAVDTEKRTFTVKRNHDGSYRVTRHGRGTFLTNVGQSPGACETKGKHGATVLAGIQGKFNGYLRGTITGGTFNPNAICPADCGFTAVWIDTFFGTGATFSCDGNSTDCKFDFRYHARHQGLKFHNWYDKGKGAGTLLHERFHGDIANA